MGLGLKSKARNTLNAIKTTLKLGDYWYWLPESAKPDQIPILPLVYPLRYDILIRKAFFDFYAANRALYKREPEEFIKLAAAHEYHAWFTQVLMVRYEPESVADPRRTLDLFRDRVHRAASLHESIASRGFDLAYPIIAFTGETIVACPGTVPEGQKYFMGDGCHRLACLMSQGLTTLPRRMIRIKCFRRLAPFDNTTMLRDHLPIAWEDFLATWPDGNTP